MPLDARGRTRATLVEAAGIASRSKGPENPLKLNRDLD